MNMEEIIAKAKQFGFYEDSDPLSFLEKYIDYTESHDLRFYRIHNISYLQKNLSQLISEEKIKDYGIAFFNLHNFSLINRKLGFEKATKVMQNFYEQLKSIVEENHDASFKGVAAAGGGDQGAVLFLKSDLSAVMKCLSNSDFSIQMDDGSVEVINISSHAGINMELNECSSSYECVDSALLAMNISRRSSGKQIIFYDNSLRDKINIQREVESWFKTALQNEEFQVYYQPKVELRTYKLKGAEALVRWFHDGKMVMPDTFIPVLERNLSIKDLDLYMLSHVCQHISEWISQGKNPVQVSVNLSRASISLDDIVSVITSTIDKYNIPRNLIQIELTESASGTSNEELKPIVQGLNAEGISTAMDDFGTGYSSLSLIKELPWDVLKIDKSLLEGAQKAGSRDQHMFKSIITMANELGLECIVEGVETREDIKLLKESNCFLAQGYYFSKPLPHSDFNQILQNQ